MAHPLFSVINGGEEVDAPATQAQITSHNKNTQVNKDDEVGGRESQCKK